MTRLEEVREAGRKIGKAVPLTVKQKEEIASVVKLHTSDRRAA